MTELRDQINAMTDEFVSVGIRRQVCTGNLVASAKDIPVRYKRNAIFPH
jgi:hypothetical protein